MKAYGKTTWMIPDTYLHSVSNLNVNISHEAICVLNTSDEDAHIKLTLYFEDREPDTSFTAVCGARRTNHIRLDRIRNEEGGRIPLDTPYSVLLESDTPVVVQYSRLDTSAPEYALMTTIGYPVD